MKSLCPATVTVNKRVYTVLNLIGKGGSSTVSRQGSCAEIRTSTTFLKIVIVIWNPVCCGRNSLLYMKYPAIFYNSFLKVFFCIWAIRSSNSDFLLRNT